MRTVMVRSLERQAWIHQNLMKMWYLSGQVRGRGSRALCTEGRGTEGMHSCVDNKAAVEERKGQAAT